MLLLKDSFPTGKILSSLVIRSGTSQSFTEAIRSTEKLLLPKTLFRSRGKALLLPKIVSLKNKIIKKKRKKSLLLLHQGHKEQSNFSPPPPLPIFLDSPISCHCCSHFLSPQECRKNEIYPSQHLFSLHGGNASAAASIKKKEDSAQGVRFHPSLPTLCITISDEDGRVRA